MVEKLTDSTFDAALAKGGVAAVDFSAAWCGPCRALAPNFEALAENYAAKAAFYKVDIDEAGDVAAKFGIMSVPTILFFKDGQVAQKSVGLKTTPALAQILDTLL